MNEKKEVSAVSITALVWVLTATLGTVLLGIGWLLVLFLNKGIGAFQGIGSENTGIIFFAAILAFVISLIGMVPQLILSTIFLNSFKNGNQNAENKFYFNLGINFLLCLLTAMLTIFITLGIFESGWSKIKILNETVFYGFLILSPYIIAWEGLLYYHSKKYFDGITAPIKENTPLDYF